MAIKTAGEAEKMNGGCGKMEDMAVKTDEAAKKSKTIGKTDGGCGEEVEDYRQKRRRMRRRRRRMSATNLRQCRRSSGQGLRNFLRKRAMCKWPQNKLLGMAENATMAAVFA